MKIGKKLAENATLSRYTLDLISVFRLGGVGSHKRRHRSGSRGVLKLLLRHCILQTTPAKQGFLQITGTLFSFPSKYPLRTIPSQNPNHHTLFGAGYGRPNSSDRSAPDGEIAIIIQYWIASRQFPLPRMSKSKNGKRLHPSNQPSKALAG